MPKKIRINGVICSNDYKEVYEWFGYEATSPNDVTRVLDNLNGEDVEILINSGGGDIWAGSDIYTALKDYQGNVIVKIVGLAASAASVIAMGGNRILMAPTAEFMIHNVWMVGQGDYRDMAKYSNDLEISNDTIVNAYRIKTGRTSEELKQLMDDETWFDAKKAKEYGFIDEIMFDTSNQLVASSGGNILPMEILNKVKNELMASKPEPEEDSVFIMQKKRALARTNTLKIGGIRS